MTATTHNEPRPQGHVRVGLIARGEPLAALAAAVDACVLLQPLGQVGQPAAGLRDIPWFDDPRTLLGQPGIEAVVLGTSTRTDIELAALAAERGLHVWRPPPVARSFPESAELVDRVKRWNTIYRVASWWEFVVDHAWHELPWPDGFVPRFSELSFSAAGPAPNDWRALPSETAGGVLATDSYDLLEALVALRGLPTRVAAALGRFRGAARDTEDTAAAVLYYADGGCAVLRATWDAAPSECVLRHHAATATVTLTRDEVALARPLGNSCDHRPLPGEFLTSELLRFAESVRSAARDRAAAPLERHLAVSALLEALYLSARTGDPESPGKFYQVQGRPEPRL